MQIITWRADLVILHVLRVRNKALQEIKAISEALHDKKKHGIRPKPLVRPHSVAISHRNTISYKIKCVCKIQINYFPGSRLLCDKAEQVLN